VELDRRQVELQQAHVLDDEGVGAGVVAFPGDAAGGLQFLVLEDGVEGYQYPGVVAVGEFAEAGDVGHAVARIGPGAEGRAADIDGVGAVDDGFHAEVGILGGGEEFKRVGEGMGHGGIFYCHRGHREHRVKAGKP